MDFKKGGSSREGAAASGILEQGHIYSEINICVIMSSQKCFFKGSTSNSSGSENGTRARNSSLTDVEESLRPPNILTASHLPSLRALLSDKKVTGCCILQYHREL